MRKGLLLSLLVPALAIGQTVEQSNMVQTTPSKSIATEIVKPSPVRVDDRDLDPMDNAVKEWLYDEVEIGETQYDLQVNNALANRLMLHDDGKVSAVFTMSLQNGPYDDRGTGYAHFDGEKWTDKPLKRLERLRAGWCNIGTVEKDGKTVEFVVSHHANTDTSAKSGGLFIMINDGIGSTNFTELTDLDVAENGPFWPRAVGSGNYIHIYTAASTKEWHKRKDEQILRPNSYYRYDVQNDVWLDSRVLFDGYDSTRFALGVSDAYQMDVKGSTIAIASGSSGQDLLLFKSTDNGENWTTTPVFLVPYPRYRDDTTLVDSMDAGNGSVEVLIDNDNNAHVFWAEMRWSNDAIDDDNSTVSLGYNSIMHWDEKSDTAMRIGGMLDLDGSGQLDVPAFQTQTDGGARYANSTLASYPDAGIDADGNIYAIYSSPNEAAFSSEGLLFRDVYVVYSSDGGETWSLPQSIVEGIETEDMFAHMARDVDDNLHIMWQRDEFPGTAVINSTPATLSKIMYAAVDKNKVLNDELIVLRHVSIDEINNSLSVSEAYPNPTNGDSWIDVALEESAQVRLSITNLMGQEVSTQNLGELKAGSNRVALGTTGLSQGVYIYNVTLGNATLTGRVVVE